MAGFLSDMSQTDASNVAFSSISQAENSMKPSDVNNDFRAHDGAVARWLGDVGAVNTVAGTGDVITVTLSQPFTAYGTSAAQIPTGALIRFIASAANTTNVTINVNTIGAKAIRKTSGGTDVALVAGDLVAGETYTMIYRSTANAAAGAWVLIGAAAIAAATTSASGIVELATVAEALTGTDAVRAVTPAGLYYPTGHLFGLTLSNNAGDATNDIDIAVGDCRDSGDTANMVLASALGKQLDVAWAVGGTTGSTLGMLATGVAVANGTYHIFLIKRPDTGVVDVAADTSVTGANIATNTNAAYTLKRRIGSVVRTGAANKAFTQVGDLFLWSSPVIDVDATNPGTSAVTRTVTVPTGIIVDAMLVVGGYGGTNNLAVYVSPLATTDLAVQAPLTAALTGMLDVETNSASASIWGTAPKRVLTNTSAQVRSRQNISGAADHFGIITQGWVDTRGRAA